VDNPSKTVKRLGASAEHNLDIYAAFSAMFQITGEVQWQADAQHARKLVEDMWDPQTGCYWSGTEGPEKIFTGTCSAPNYECRIPLDVQTWSVMAIPDTLKLHPQVLASIEQKHRNTHDGFTGFDFNDDRDSVWFEGTSQAVVAYELAGRRTEAEFFRRELQRAQQALGQDPHFGNSLGVPAASHDGLTTGFDPPPIKKDGKDEPRIFHYYYRPHVGATAWNVFAQLQVNPYYLAKVNPCSSSGLDAAVNYVVGLSSRSPADIIKGDFNGDGNPDLAVANFAGTITVLLGNGTGGFVAVKEYLAGAGTCAGGCFVDNIVEGDFDADGKRDLAVTIGADNVHRLGVLSGNGDGSFSAPRYLTIAGEPKSLAAQDFNNDGKTDLAVVYISGVNDSVAILLSDGTGSFGAARILALSGHASTTSSLVTGDFNTDGKLDLIVPISSPPWGLSLLLGVGNGSFDSPQSVSSIIQPSHVAVGDFNKDGKLDLAVTHTPRAVSVLLGSGMGSFTLLTSISFAPDNPEFIAVGDFNSDRNPDLAVIAQSSGVMMLPGNATGNFGAPIAFPVGNSPAALAVADLNCDGKDDLAVANAGSANVSVLLSNCSATPSPALVSAASYGGLRLAPDSIGTLFGSDLANGIALAPGLPLPTQLAGTSVKFRDSANVERLAPLFFVSPTQVNLQIPPGMASGLARVTVVNGAGRSATATAQIDMVAPGIFSADASGQGLPAGYVVRVRADNSQQDEQIGRFDPTTGKIVPIPIDLGPASDKVVLALFGTGWRFCGSLSATTAKVGGADVSVLYAGSQPTLVGVDQVNLLLPRSLMGRDLVDVEISFCGKTANVVTLAIK